MLLRSDAYHLVDGNYVEDDNYDNDDNDVDDDVVYCSYYYDDGSGYLRRWILW